MRHILGISAYYHDSAAALVSGGRIIAAAQEERFSRRKNDPEFPDHAVSFCLRQGGLRADELDAVVFYDKPVQKFTRLLETFLAIAPRGLRSFVRVLPSWLHGKLNLPTTLRDAIPGLSDRCSLLFTGHHQAHAASAFFPSPFSEAAILTVDGVGEWTTTAIGSGRGSSLELLRELRFPHSLGLLYSAFTAYCGFRVNSGEYKLMGLAPYGEPRFADQIREHLVDLREDGSFRLNLEYFDFLAGETMTHERFHRLFGGEPRRPDQPIEPRHLDLARSIQEVTGEMMLNLARETRRITGMRHLCLAGGVALNCVANGQLLRAGLFDRIWVQPAAGDAGGALGAALAAWHEHQGKADSSFPRESDLMQGSFLGPEYSAAEIEGVLREWGAVYHRYEEEHLLDKVVESLAREKVVGWFQGRMEYGPRALGNRSILGDPRSSRMQSVMNLKIKFRESFRPFAPAVLRERVTDYFELSEDSPYMLLVAPVRESLRLPVEMKVQGLDRLGQRRSELPAVTHVDYSARVQTVDAERNRLFHRLLKVWEAATGCGVLVNTSFNVRGEPVVCTPDDAYRCFMNTEMDALALGPFLLRREEQPLRAVARKVALQED
ncbi:MAG: carbamoyltransferase [Verrucomicrobia bacterium]|nr:carbamoyltransferase [Verrucomicrobiota bacterium]